MKQIIGDNTDVVPDFENHREEEEKAALAQKREQERKEQEAREKAKKEQEEREKAKKEKERKEQERKEQEERELERKEQEEEEQEAKKAAGLQGAKPISLSKESSNQEAAPQKSSSEVLQSSIAGAFDGLPGFNSTAPAETKQE